MTNSTRHHPPSDPDAVDTTGLYWAERNEEIAAKARDALVRCARDRDRVPTTKDYRRWLRSRQRRGEYPPTVFVIELVFNGWPLALYDAGLAASPIPGQPSTGHHRNGN